MARNCSFPPDCNDAAQAAANRSGLAACGTAVEPQAPLPRPLPRPEPPLPSDCCGSGCAVCVFEAYERDLQRWAESQPAPERSA